MPQFEESIEITVLDGTGVKKEEQMMTANFKCAHPRSYQGSAVIKVHIADKLPAQARIAGHGLGDPLTLRELMGLSGLLEEKTALSSLIASLRLSSNTPTGEPSPWTLRLQGAVTARRIRS